MSVNLRLFRALLRSAGAALCLIVVFGALAQAQAQDQASLIAQESQAWIEKAVASARPTGAAPLRMAVQVGALDSRLALAPCAQVEPYMPIGTRLWGKTRIGLRCIDGASRWNVFLPVQVQAMGQTWVMRNDVAAGATLQLDDAVLAEVDWAQENQSVLADPEMWVGQTATRALRTGMVLRHGMVRPSQVFQAGSMVRIVAQGPGFQVTSGGQALSAGVVGEMARVRVDNGRVVSGLVLDMRTVQVNL
ncbi:MAG: flagellar basal body P-ring formation protein FlgA [Rhodoferax sp.]|jgi:flagella basal body P-ring formation protein FlgA|nr:flagellar basal body P-ring formation protein FlgA [Rhodoferax sp.]MBP9928255.1 flagellar basal body P-ring formation protein FlgA [Rhodoferax sp.]HQX58413.1 flagellar basal body P-ring formation chaperone FlgA [Burkholderiaceae bacterium]HQZ08194.1 flagellar basal body P-ring formation chaperone FlgA [Burkholderiaceae bacterium]HRA61454.1 flagellar basal body P-ring formation chaperone FlgA [Burkholderiaceae bacterium]